MSRSIHIPHTRVRLWERDYWDEKLDEKLRVRFCISDDRRSGPTERGVCDVEAIPFLIRDETWYVHYPATSSDIRGLMSVMPKGISDGVASVELCFKSAFYDGDGIQLIKRVFCPQRLGTYRAGRIYLNGYVYDPTRSDCDVAILEMWLRFRMLATLVHELAHHVDATTRTARGRWHGRESKGEEYAYATEARWTEKYVTPYLEESYPALAQQLADIGEWPLAFNTPPAMLATNALRGLPFEV